VHRPLDHGFKPEVNGRAAQLDGLRAIAMLAICWDHWTPQSWPRVFPFEIFLFFFLVLSGYLVTGSLLRERDRAEARGGPWKRAAMKTYQIRRGLRILAPYYAALALALLVYAPEASAGLKPDIWSGLGWYVTHLSNFHMATLPKWPGGTNHFWSLAMQQQFYLIWPFVIWFVPRNWLVLAVGFIALIAPTSRYIHSHFALGFTDTGLLTWCALDYFGIGGLLAIAIQRGMSLESSGLRGISWLALAGYVAIFGSHKMGWETYGLRPIQQSLLAIALCGYIASGLVGFRGRPGKWLESSFLQRIGQVSYGIYLFHNLAPLVAGKLFWFLWRGPLDSLLGEIVRIPVYAAITWGLTLASWRWIEQPLQGVRAKLAQP
jgi:peptidoglycan/LPS O-acetylase OafA/YrhL